MANDEKGEVEALYLKRATLPTTFFIDREGVIRYVRVGPMTETFIEEQLGELEG